MNVPRFHLCRSLRWKSHSRESNDPREIASSLERSATQFHCAQTCQAWGPDDELAAPELCAPDRPCFAQSSTVLAPGEPDLV
jgi:hypothetical protein